MTTNKTTDALLGCPFCGSQPVWGLDKKTGCQLHGDPIQYVNLSCQGCEFRPSVRGGCRYRGGDKPEYDKEAKKVAADKWNTRAATKPAQGVCGMGEDCDLTIAYMKGFSDGKADRPKPAQGDRAALQLAAETFRLYEQLHRAKPDHEKADRNKHLAEIMEAALTDQKVVDAFDPTRGTTYDINEE